MTRALTALALVAALLVSGCGSDDKATIPQAESDRLVDLLRQARVQAGDQDRCDKLADLVSQIRAEVDQLPSSVDRDTRRSLDDGVGRLEDSSREECKESDKTETTETTPTETETTPPPTETETAPPPTETETAPPPTETEPPPPPPEEIPEEGEVPGNGGTPPGQEKKERKKGKEK